VELISAAVLPTATAVGSRVCVLLALEAGAVTADRGIVGGFVFHILFFLNVQEMKRGKNLFLKFGLLT
jgi:hypothetical protein